MRQRAYDTGMHRGAPEAADNPLITGAAQQAQPRYQTPKLLVGALSQGFRVAEVPTMMRRRVCGDCERGGSAFAGLGYAR
jgi:hypothetical protein